MNRIIIITGTRKGIGKELALFFLKEGDIVFGCSRRNADIIDTNYTHFNIDISDEIAVCNMVRQIQKKHLKIDILINNAGVASMNHMLLTPYSTVKKIFETNFYGTFLLSREVGKVMLRNKYGRIINFSTVAVPLNLEGELIYSSSKSAIEKLTKIMSKELGTNGITVNAIGPTPIMTDLIKNVPEEKIQNLIDKQSIKRLGVFSDILNVVKFFISNESEFITGQVIYLGGVS